jgi:COP9 signalosome complex subunit 5
MIVMDAFALPVEGTETRVSAQDQAYEYMVAYMEKIKEVGVAKKGDGQLCWSLSN